MLPLDPMVKGGADMLGDAGPPLVFEKFEDDGESREAVSGVTFNGDWRSSDPDMPISRPDACQGWLGPPPHHSPGVQGRCWEPWMMEETDMTGFSFLMTIMVVVVVETSVSWCGLYTTSPTLITNTGQLHCLQTVHGI